MVGEPEPLTLEEQLARLITVLEAQAATPAVVFTRPLRTTAFTISSVGLNTQPLIILQANPDRLAFTLLLSSTRLYRFASTPFGTARIAIISGADAAQFGIEGHVGALYGSADAATTVTVVEQFADPIA